jgi:hypothetical protein
MSSPARSFANFYFGRLVSDIEVPPDGTCSICLDTYNGRHEAVRVRVRACMHVFGRTCLHEWASCGQPQSNSCPLCRTIWFTRGSDLDYPRDTNTALLFQNAIRSFRVPRRFNPENQMYTQRPSRAAPTSHTQRQTLPMRQGQIHSAVQIHVDTIRQQINSVERLNTSRLPRDTQDELLELEARLRSLRLDSSSQASPGAVPSRRSVTVRSSNATVGGRNTLALPHTGNFSVEALIDDINTVEPDVHGYWTPQSQPRTRNGSPYPRSALTTHQQNSSNVSVHNDSSVDSGAVSALRRVQQDQARQHDHSASRNGPRRSILGRIVHSWNSFSENRRTRSSSRSPGLLTTLAAMENCERRSSALPRQYQDAGGRRAFVNDWGGLLDQPTW